MAPTRASAGSPGRTTWPSRRASPRSGRTRPTSTRSVVVLPAPFGPRSPHTSPFSTANPKSSTASTSRKRLVSPDTAITGTAPEPTGAAVGSAAGLLLLLALLLVQLVDGVARRVDGTTYHPTSAGLHAAAGRRRCRRRTARRAAPATAGTEHDGGNETR